MNSQFSLSMPSQRARPLSDASTPLVGALAQQLNCRLETSFAKLEAFRDAWDHATSRLGGSIYLSYDWSRLWWEFYGAGKALRIFVFSSADEIVAILPIFIDLIRFGPFRLKIARLVGSNIPPKVFNPPVAPALANDVFERVLRQLFGEEGCDALSFGPVSELHSSAEALLRAARRAPGLVARASPTSGNVHSVWHLPETIDEYFQSLSRNERKNRKADLKKLQAEHAGRVEVVRAPGQVEAEFEAFRQQHAAQWVPVGKSGHFGAWPRATEFNRALVQAHGRLGRVRFVRILAREKTIANLYAYAFGGCYYSELPARSLDPQWDRFSLGPAGIVATIGAAIGEGITRMEGGLNHYDYKLRLNAKEHATTIIRLVANRLSNRLRFSVFVRLRACAQLAYDALWRERLLPRLPARLRRPQWRGWLSLDF